MTIPITLTVFDDDTVVDIDLINANFRKLASAVNTLAGTQIIAFNTLPTDESSGFVPLTGARMTGTLTAPNFRVIDGAGFKGVIIEDQMATTATAGLVKQGNHVAKISEGQDPLLAFDALIDTLRARGVIADAS
jgi:hypothetical protein